MKSHDAHKEYVWFDWAMKHILREKSNFRILEGFVSTIIGQEMHIVEILESEVNQVDETAKFNRVDIKARNSEEEIVIIEVQVIRQLDFIKRMLWGVANAITEQLSLGDSYEKVHKVYAISVVYFDLCLGDDYVYRGQTHLRGLHTQDELQFTRREGNAFTTYTSADIFPEYYLVRVKNFDPDRLSNDPLDQWLRYLKTGKIAQDADAHGLPEAREKLLYDAMTPYEKKAFREHMEDMNLEKSALADSYAEGAMKGYASGRQQEKLENARNLKANGVPTALIAKSLGLTDEEVASL